MIHDDDDDDLLVHALTLHMIHMCLKFGIKSRIMSESIAKSIRAMTMDANLLQRNAIGLTMNRMIGSGILADNRLANHCQQFWNRNQKSLSERLRTEESQEYEFEIEAEPEEPQPFPEIEKLRVTKLMIVVAEREMLGWQKVVEDLTMLKRAQDVQDDADAAAAAADTDAADAPALPRPSKRPSKRLRSDSNGRQ